jgi:hypothetical protein
MLSFDNSNSDLVFGSMITKKQTFGSNKTKHLSLIKITHHVTYVIFCVNTYISEARFQHVVWVGCSAAHTEVLVLTYKILDLDNLQMMTSSCFKQIHTWNTLSACSVSRKSWVIFIRTRTFLPFPNSWTHLLLLIILVFYVMLPCALLGFVLFCLNT